MKVLSKQIHYYFAILLLSYCSVYVQANEADWQYDIANIPPKYQSAFEVSLRSWRTLQQKEREFNKALGLEVKGVIKPYGSNLVGATLVHFTYPWSLNQPVPFSIGYTGYGAPYFNHYQPRNRLEELPEIKGNLDAVFIKPDIHKLNDKDKKKPIKLHLNHSVGETSLFLFSANDWFITWDKGVKVNQIIVPQTSGNYTIKTQTPIKITRFKQALFAREDRNISYKKNVDWFTYQKVKHRIKESIGIFPRSISFSQHRNLVLDGKRNQPSVPAGKMVSGLWYFEATVQENEQFYLDRENSYAKLGHKLVNVVKAGDVLQFAVNLDASRLYIGLNGEWVLGDPNYKESGYRLAPDRTVPIHLPKKEAHPIQKITHFNYGEHPFSYQLPEGYRPYASDLYQGTVTEKYIPERYTLQPIDLLLPTFPEQVYARTSTSFKTAWQGLQSAIRDYRKKACALTYAYKSGIKVDYQHLDPQCVWLLKGHIKQKMKNPIKDLLRVQLRKRQQLPKIEAGKVKLHLLAYYDKQPHSKVAMKVTDTTKPLVLVLLSKKSHHWNIQLAEGVEVAQVIFFGLEPQQYRFNRDTDAKVNVYSKAEKTDRLIRPAIKKGAKSVTKMKAQIKKLLGVTPTTLQICKDKLHCHIDGVTTLLDEPKKPASIVEKIKQWWHSLNAYFKSLQVYLNGLRA